MWMFLERYGRVLRMRRGRGCCEGWRDLTCTTIRFDSSEIFPLENNFPLKKIHQKYTYIYKTLIVSSLVKTHGLNDAQKVPFQNFFRFHNTTKFRARGGKIFETASDGFKVTGRLGRYFPRTRGRIYIYIYRSGWRAGGAGAITSRCFCFSTRLLLSHYPTTTVRTFFPAHSGPHATFQPDTCCSAR